MKFLPSVRKQDKQAAQIAEARTLAWKNAHEARDQRDADRKMPGDKQAG